MATAVVKSQCSVCKKETSTFNCDGCSQKFCRIDLNKHLQLLSEQLDQIEVNHDQLRQKLFDQKHDSRNHSLIQEINTWEENSIRKIKQVAEQCRQDFINCMNKSLPQLESDLNNLAREIKCVRDEDAYNEIDLNQLKEKLGKLDENINKPRNVSIKYKSASFIKKIRINTQSKTKWKQNGSTILGENGQGNQLNQFKGPTGIFIGDDQTLYIVDNGNHRIMEWELNAKDGRIVAGGNGKGQQTNQLNGPSDVIKDKKNNCLIIADFGNRRVMRWSLKNNTTSGEVIISNIDCLGLAIDKDGSLYASDCKKDEIRRWRKGENSGTIVAGGNGNGDRLDQLNWPKYLFIDDDYSLYVSDSRNHRVMKWVKYAKEGAVIAGGNGKGNSLKQLSRPQAVVVDPFGQIYVVDFDNHRVMCWHEGEKAGNIVVGGNGHGDQSNQLYNPRGLSFDREGNLYVCDSDNHRIQKFEVDFD